MSSADTEQQVYRFADFTLDTARGALCKDGTEIRLRPQSLSVLQILLENHDRLVSRDEVHTRVWGSKFVTSDSLAQCLVEIRKALGDNDRRIIRTVPRRGYTVGVDVAAEPAVSTGTETPIRRLRWASSSVAAVVLFSVVAWMASAWLARATRTAAEQDIPTHSVAVLPFVNMSDDVDNEYFSDGLTETLSHLLAQSRELKVAARTSSFAFKGKNTDIREIGSMLGVAHVLAGSVQRYGDRIRITAQLNRTSDGFHVWSETYDREIDDVFAIQDEIAEAVGVKLLASLFNPADLDRRRELGTGNLKAYDLYLRARAEMSNGSVSAFRSAEIHLTAALEQDPSFLDAKAELADLMLQQADTGMRTFADGIERLTTLAGEVLARDPDHPRVRSLLLTTQTVKAAIDGDLSVWAESEPELRRIAASAPNDSTTKLRLAQMVARFGDPLEALRLLEDVRRSDPLNTFVYEMIATTYAQLHDYEAARDALFRATEIDPDAPNPQAKLGNVALQLGDGVLAVDCYLVSQANDPLDPEFPGKLAAFLYLLGLPDEAGEFHTRVRRLAPGSEDAQNLDLLRALALGELDRAIETAREIVADGTLERWTAWRNAARLLLFTSAQRGTEEEDLEFMDRHVADFSNLDSVAVARRTNITRRYALDLFAATRSLVELREFRDRAAAYSRQSNTDIDARPLVRMDWQMLFNDKDAAMQTALEEVFTRPVTVMPMWRLRFSRPFLRDLVNEPEVQEALQRLDQQESDIRSEVKRYLSERLHSRAYVR